LLDSLDVHVDEDAEAAWATQINRRIAELEAGNMRTIRWPEMRRRLFVRARHRALIRLREGLDLQWVPGSREDIKARTKPETRNRIETEARRLSEIIDLCNGAWL
jgi:hypothetical protein